jgi:hypothetical protein
MPSCGALGFPGRPAIPIATSMIGVQESVLADVNGDGVLDLIAAGHGVSVSLGDGHGGFGPMASYAPTGLFWSVAVGDLNGDGKPDLVVTGVAVSPGSLAFPLGVLLNQGREAPSPHPSLPAAWRGRARWRWRT